MDARVGGSARVGTALGGKGEAASSESGASGLRAGRGGARQQGVCGAPEDVVAAASEVEEGRVLLEPLGGMLDDKVGVAHVACEKMWWRRARRGAGGVHRSRGAGQT